MTDARPDFLIGQRVIVGREIGIVCRSKIDDPPDTYRVRLSSSSFESWYDWRNVRPLPNGQL